MAGCLFEVSLPASEAGRWRWTNTGPEVTVLGDTMRDGRQHFRFRAEGSGATTGLVALQFGRAEGEPRPTSVFVRIAPEPFDERE